MIIINFNKNFQICIDLIDKEDYLPSFCLKISLMLNKPNLNTNIDSNNLWFELENWLLFIEFLKNVNTNDEFSLFDMSEKFVIKVVKKNNLYEIVYALLSTDIETKKEDFNFKFTENLNSEEFFEFTEKLNSVTKLVN